MASRESSKPTWQPGAESSSPHCARCGHRVSHAFHRQWADNDGDLNGCRECLPRSVRFGEDVYDRDPDDVEDFDRAAFNKNHPNGGVQRKHGTDQV